jgi:AcrR family transcriptional regulator
MARTGRRPVRPSRGTRSWPPPAGCSGNADSTATTIRAIATEAGVNQALVHHFFGTKEQIFIAAVNFPLDPAVVLPIFMDGPPDEFGQRVARFLLSVWGHPTSRAPLLALLRSSTGNEQAAAMLRDLLGSVLFSRFAEATGSSRLKVAATAGQVVGVMLLRYVIQVEPLASAPDDDVVAILAPVIQGCLPERVNPA